MGIDYDPTDIEDAILEALQPLLEAKTVKTLESYAGQLDTEDVSRITYAFPALYVAWSESKLDQGAFPDAVEGVVTILVCDGNLRGTNAARRGAPDSSGVFALLKAVRALLHRQSVLTDWGDPVWTGEHPVGIDDRKGIAVYAQTYKIVTEFDPD